MALNLLDGARDLFKRIPDYPRTSAQAQAAIRRVDEQLPDAEQSLAQEEQKNRIRLFGNPKVISSKSLEDARALVEGLRTKRRVLVEELQNLLREEAGAELAKKWDHAAELAEEHRQVLSDLDGAIVLVADLAVKALATQSAFADAVPQAARDWIKDGFDLPESIRQGLFAASDGRIGAIGTLSPAEVRKLGHHLVANVGAEWTNIALRERERNATATKEVNGDGR